MARRNVLHHNHMEPFRAWLDSKGIEHRPGRGAYEVMQIKQGSEWRAVFTKARAPEHVSVPETLVALVRRFLRDRREAADREK